MSVALNIDLGEHDGEPEELFSLAHLVNVACGGHAGDAASMERAVLLAKASRSGIGAHPSYEDREHFGRVSLSVDPVALAASIRRQGVALVDVARRLGATVGHVKAHGALYHDVAADPSLAKAFLEGVAASVGHVAIVGPGESALAASAKELGFPFLREGFVDRGYTVDGVLIPRSQPGALLSDPHAATAQTARLVATGLFETICVHGDTPNALAIARAVRAALGAP